MSEKKSDLERVMEAMNNTSAKKSQIIVDWCRDLKDEVDKIGITAGDEKKRSGLCMHCNDQKERVRYLISQIVEVARI